MKLFTTLEEFLKESKKEDTGVKDDITTFDSDIVIAEDGKITSRSYKKWYENIYKKIMDQPFVPKPNTLIMK